MDQAEYRALFRQALKIRMVEDKIIELYPSDRIQSPVHLSIGQEAVAVGFCAALAPRDWIFGTYRSHAFFIAKGGDLSEMFAELYGRRGGGCKGKAGSMHLTAPDVGYMGSSAVVASNIPHAVGAALAAKRRGTGQVIVAAFGDGATEEGVAHESLNFAALHRLPVVFLCENNGLAVHSPQAARQSYDIGAWAGIYGIDYVKVEQGWDFVAVRDAVTAPLARVRAGAGPLFVEIRTFRYKEHVGPGDDFHAGYRSREALERWRAHDPLVAHTGLVADLAPGIAAEIAAAVAFAEASPLPGRDDLLTDVI